MIYFVTGTDTGVGKTFVSAALLREARAAGKRVFGFKPIETGCSGDLGDDQRVLCAAAGGWQRGPQQGLYRLRRPVAPRVAAEAEGIAIDLDLVVRTAQADVDLTVVEGAGGWRVPITADADMSTLARRLGAAVVLVARAGLGTINHSLLSIEAIERDGCRLAAVILSCHPEDAAAFAAENAAEIRRRWAREVIVFHGKKFPAEHSLW